MYRQADSNHGGIKLPGCSFCVVIILAYTISFLEVNFIRTVEYANLKINMYRLISLFSLTAPLVSKQMIRTHHGFSSLSPPSLYVAGSVLPVIDDEYAFPFRLIFFIIFIFLAGYSEFGTSLLMSPFCIFDRCLDSNPESCHSKQALTNYSHHSP
jgi:hypothetical protein